MSALSRLVFLTLSVALLFALSGCGSDSSGGSGTLDLRLTDAPAPIPGLEALTIVFDHVTVHKSDSADPEDAGWETVVDSTAPVADRTFDLLQLVNGNIAALGLTDLSAGQYTQIRVAVQDATVTISATDYPVTIPSGTQTGLKIVRPFTVTAGETLSLLMDFDVGQSLKDMGDGSYQLSPVIRLVDAAEVGAISGTVTVGGVAPSTTFAVSAYPAGNTTNPASTSYTNEVGDYVISALEPGDYDVYANDGSTSNSIPVTVTVTAGATATADIEL